MIITLPQSNKLFPIQGDTKQLLQNTVMWRDSSNSGLCFNAIQDMY